MSTRGVCPTRPTFIPSQDKEKTAHHYARLHCMMVVVVWFIHGMDDGSHTPHLCVALSCKLLQQEEEEIASRALSGCGWLDVRLVSERERLAASAWPAGQQNRLPVVPLDRLARVDWPPPRTHFHLASRGHGRQLRARVRKNHVGTAVRT
jgi:hypothetical protein